MKVLVIGAGQAGRAAAQEAARDGADVTLVDSLASPLPDWRLWPDFIPGGEKEFERTLPLPRDLGATLTFGTTVTEVRDGSARSSDGRVLPSDAFVLAPGSEFLPSDIAGRRKAGVVVLDSPGEYAMVGVSLPSSAHPVVVGEGWRGVEVAEKLAQGAGVLLAVSAWEPPAPGGGSLDVIAGAAAESGVGVTLGGVSRVLGNERVEAVVCSGRVAPADLVAVVPERRPRRVKSPVDPEWSGALTVGLDMKSGARGVFAAGAAAKPSGSPSGAGLAQEQAPSGRVAGANAAGRRVSLSSVRKSRRSAFGVRWTAMFFPARATGPPGRSELKGGREACTLYYDRRSGEVTRVELVEDLRRPELLVSSLRDLPTLKSLAYDGSADSSDISLVSETARKGLKEWSGS